MENTELFPLSRNKYFFGKLLTGRDMEAEQTYMNNKRRLLNALLYGPGVVCGLGVMKLNDIMVAVESGLAFDGLGREVALDKPVVARLSELAGFGDDYGTEKHVYLCAEYRETPSEPVRALTDAPLDEEKYGRAEERARLYLRYGEPDAREISAPPEDPRSESLENKLERGLLTRLYLARIRLSRWEDAFEIEGIDVLPFGQKAAVPSAPEHVPPPPAAPERPLPPPPRDGLASPPAPARAFGTAAVDIPGGSRYGSLHYSGDIVHGLGMTGVCVTLGLQTGGGAVFGNPSIFCPREYEWAAKTDEESGTFKIGVRLKTESEGEVVRFIWAAETDPAWAGAATPAPQILITPGSVRLTFRQSVQFTAEARGMSKQDIVWYAEDQDSGGITKEGFYVAPDRQGVYTVRAASASLPDVTGTAFVVVIPPP
ncbi:MAG: hypothetical protein LBR85_00485 [Oscillospiraceae bacterium]|jgi:hypothetical protein|nr:hypothetical protein [Oscillospiraceae bacterium]